MSRIRTWIVGREPGCEVVLDDASVSRRHAEVVRLSDGRLHVTDRATTNGTFILRGGEWRAVRQTWLGPADHIRFGDRRLTGRRLDALCPRDGVRPARGAEAAGASAGGSMPRGPRKDAPDANEALMRDPETGEIIEREPAPPGRRGR